MDLARERRYGDYGVGMVKGEAVACGRRGHKLENREGTWCKKSRRWTVMTGKRRKDAGRDGGAHELGIRRGGEGGSVGCRWGR